MSVQLVDECGSCPRTTMSALSMTPQPQSQTFVQSQCPALNTGQQSSTQPATPLNAQCAHMLHVDLSGRHLMLVDPFAPSPAHTTRGSSNSRAQPKIFAFDALYPPAHSHVCFSFLGIFFYLFFLISSLLFFSLTY